MEPSTQRTLERKLGLFPVTNIVIANMVGAGIFTTSGLLMSGLGNPVVMLGLWIVGGIIALCGALGYGALGAAMPQAGGEYIFLSRLYHPLIGFLSGWVSFVVGFSAPIAASALGFSEYLGRAFPQLLTWGGSIGLDDPAATKKILSMSVILLFTAIHMRGIEFGARVQSALTILKVALIVGLLLVGFGWGKGDVGHFAEGGTFALDFGGWKSVGLSLIWIMFAYSGWNASTYIGSEIQNPSINVPRSLVLGTGVVIALYLGLNALFLYAVRPEEMKGVIAVGGLAMAQLFGGSMDAIVSLLISCALFSSLSAFIILGPRVYFSMAKDGYFFKSVSTIHPRFSVPARAIVLQSAISVVMLLSGTLDQVLTYMGFSLGVFPLLAVVGVFRLKRTLGVPPRFPGYPVVTIFYVLASFFVLTLAFLERPVESSIALVTVLAGVPVFFLFRATYLSPRQAD